MENERLAQYLENGLPHLRQVSKLPEWLAPGVPAVASQLGDEAILELAEPLGISEKIRPCLAQAPEANLIPDEAWLEVIGRWQAVQQVVPVTMALLRAREKIEALERRGAVGIRSVSTARGLATIAYAAFAPKGGKILDRLSVVLDGSPLEPAALLNRYVKALEDGDRDTLDGVEKCVLQDPDWAEWTRRFIVESVDFPFIPRLIGVSPVPTGELIQLLAAMIVEVTNADHSRDIKN